MEQQPLDRSRKREPVRWFRPGDWPILVKILLSMVAMVMLTLAIATAVNTFTLYTDLRAQIGANFESLADAQINHLGDILSEQLTILRSITLIDEIQFRMAKANARYQGDQVAIEAELLSTDQEWLVAADDSQLVRSIVDPQSNPLTSQLLDFMQTFPDHVEIFLTDRYGGLLAATGRTSDYYQADEGWWQAAYNDGHGAYYISQPEYDESAGYTALDMAVPIVSGRGEVVGVARTTYRVEALYQVVSSLRLGETGHVAVVDAAGIVVADPNPARVGQQMPPAWIAPEIVGVASGWQELEDNEGESVLAGHASIANIEVEHQDEAQAIRSLDWVLFVNQSQGEAYAPVTGATWRGILAAGVFTLVAAALALILARTVVTPITNLVAVARGMAADDLSIRARPRRRDETGELARAINSMADEIAGMVGTLEKRVAERTRDLQAAAQVARATTSLLDLDELLRRVVNLVQERFDLYYVGLFLIDEAAERGQRFAVLRAGTGEPGRQMLAQGHRLEVGGESMIGQCATSGQAGIALDVGEEAVRFDNPLLPDTRSEMALPLRARGRVVGAMTVQDTREAAFGEADIAVMQTMADQVAVAIDNARLFAATQAALEEMETTHQRYLGQAWGGYASARAGSGYVQTEAGLVPLGDEILPETQRVMAERRTMASDGGGDTEGKDGPSPPALVVPLVLRDQPIGALGLRLAGRDRQWTEEEVALAETIAEQFALAADNLRLLEETQRRAAQERLVSEVTGRMRQTLDMDAVLRTAVREIGESLGLHDLTIQLEIDKDGTE